MAITPIFGEQSVSDLLLRYGNKRLNLNPGFQRNSVWTLADRKRLIQSIISNYPLPSIFLYKRQHNGRLIYDVIDGKQRIETILMFTRTGQLGRYWFDVKVDLGDGAKVYDWRALQKIPDRLAAFEGYKLQTTEVEGELSEIVDLFVRINSTGKSLTSGEKRHARFYQSKFLKEAEFLVTKHIKYVLSQRILSKAQIGRMKGTELFAELLMSINSGGPINKKTSLDRSIGNDGINSNTLAKLSREFSSTIRRLKVMFPKLHQTRLHNSADFYSLFLVIWEMEKDKFILRDAKRNRIAFQLLLRLSNGVDSLRERLRKAQTARPSERLYSDYLLTVQGDTDSSSNRQRRADILKGLLLSLYERRDDRRAFTSEQRRLVWNSDDKKLCKKCGKPLDWSDFSVDHIIAYARGGKTTLKNAQPMHRSCNSSKGVRHR